MTFAKIGSGLLALVYIFVLCFFLGASYGACKAGATQTYRLLNGER